MNRIKSFTLAETMIVIVVLGIIATLTIPALVNKNKESVAKTKVRKAMAAYESALNKMIIENDLKSDDTLTAWAGAVADCGNPTQYFKKVQGDGCIFKTSDGIWWNISNIERPLIAFKEDDLDQAKANAENNYSAFVLVGRFGNDGSLRVDDLAYETANSVDDANGNTSKAQVEKLYTLLGLKSSSAGGGNQSPFAACNHADTCVVNGITYTKVMIEEDYSETYQYCAPVYFDENENWGQCGENNDKWQTKISEVTAGEYYIANEEYLSDYDNQAQNMTGSTCGDYCGGYDYYNAAKRHCSGNLATVAQLKALANQGLLPEDSCFWASEERSLINVNTVCNFGNISISSNHKYKEGYDYQVLCIGN